MATWNEKDRKEIFERMRELLLQSRVQLRLESIRWTAEFEEWQAAGDHTKPIPKIATGPSIESTAFGMFVQTLDMLFPRDHRIDAMYAAACREMELRDEEITRLAQEEYDRERQ